MDARDGPGGPAGRPDPGSAGRAPTNGRGGLAEQPIAIVGMACRFPGAEGLAEFWRLLERGESAVTEGEPGSGAGRIGELFGAEVESPACRFGAFVDGIDRFDAAFFRISPIEAQLLDPQQRLMLETSWRALENAGIDPGRLKGSRTGVYAGISNNEYRGLVTEATEISEPAAGLYSVTGTSFNTAIGRVAYALGLQGPAIALDTACSSSLVAVHQAVVGLQRGEADLALAGGVHAILSGRLFEMRAVAGMLSPNGRCKTFDAAADGYVRGEGCGILVLKRLAEAEADGDRIWAVIRGSALNQDGASAGLTVPNGEAQELVIAEALRRAGVAPAEIDYLEAHGTGTPVGDPIELGAVANAYGRGRPADRPLLIGSLKTNMGHLEAAAGVASLIKIALAMNRGVIPQHLHFETPSPEIDWDRLPVRVTAEATEWPPAADRPPLAGASGFGWSGTNAHVVVEGYGPAGRGAGHLGPAGPPRPVAAALPAGMAGSPAPAAGADREVRLLPLSARSRPALVDLAGRYVAWLDGLDGLCGLDGGPGAGDPRAADSGPGPGPAPADPGAARWLADMAWTAGVGRSHHGYRAGVTFSDAGSLREGLGALAAAEPEPGDMGGGAVTRAPHLVAFVYTGQASQWVGMGEALYEREPVVRAVLDRCDGVLAGERGVSLLDVMFGRTEAGDLDDPAWTQPAIYALECALTSLWESVGIRPGVVLGHSLGEIAAATAAGILPLEGGLRFAAARGTLMGALPSDGAMAAVYAPAARVEAAVEEQNAASPGPGVSIAADNGAQQVISGPAAGVDGLAKRFESEGLWVARLRRSPAYHSALVEPALDDLEAVVDGLDVAEAACSYVSSMTGRAIGPDERLDGSYWRRQARRPVAFRRSVETLAEVGVEVVVEVGPQAVLGPMVQMGWPDTAPAAPVSISSLQGPAGDRAAGSDDGGFTGAVAAAYEAGLAVSFEGMHAGEQRRRISLPDYPFERLRHWVDAPRRRRAGAGHPLLGTRHESPRGETAFATEIAVSDPEWLDDHRVFGRALAPGSLFGAMAASAVWPGGDGSVVVEDLQLRSPLIIPDGEPEDAPAPPARDLQLLLEDAADPSRRRFEVFSRAPGEDGWTLHAEGRVGVDAGPPERNRIDPGALTAGLTVEDVAAFYRSKADDGVHLGPSFRTLRALWSGAGEAAGEVALPESVDRRGAEVHPVLLDGCLQVVATARKQAELEDDGAYLVFGCDRFWLAGAMPERVFCHATLRTPAGAAAAGDGPLEVISADLRIYTPAGVQIGGLSGYTVKRATRATLLSATEGVQDLLYEVVWRDRDLAPAMPPADFLPASEAVAAESDPFSAYLAAEGVDAGGRAALLGDLERLAWSYALVTLEAMGWERRAGETLDPEELRQRFGVAGEHRKLFRRMCELLATAGVLEARGEVFGVLVGADDPLPAGLPADPERFADRMAARYPHGSNEVGLFRRSAGALADVLVGRADPLTLLFSSGEPTAADLYRKAPVARAANRMLRDAVALLLAALPDGRRLRVLEVGAGTGSATAAVLPELPEGRFDYLYTDISAGFFAEAEAQFGGAGAGIDYRVLDIEADPIAQGFDRHGYDLVIASNVLHATRFLPETLAHCREVLAPSGQLVALENLRGQGWLDLTFGQLDGWWRFADDYRPHHALAGPAVWCRALADAGFEGAEVLGLETSDSTATPDRGVIIAAGPAEVTEPAGLWVLAADHSGVAAGLAAELAARNQTVVLAGSEPVTNGTAGAGVPEIIRLQVEPEGRDSWRALLEALPGDVPLCGVVHLMGTDGHGPGATTDELAEDTRQAAASALALLQGLADVDATPAGGVWFVTRGAQVLEKERTGELAGATLWGLGKVAAREAAHLQPRMIDLDPAAEVPVAELAGELLHPDAETHVAYRSGRRRAARLVRASTEPGRLALPEETGWLLEPDEGGALENMRVVRLPERSLRANEVRVAIEATGLNFWDMFRALAVIDEGLLGGEFCGRVLEAGSEVSGVSEADLVVGLAFGTFASEVITSADMVAPAPDGIPVTALATIPTAFTSAQLSYDQSGLRPGERVLIHAGAGGVGLAAIQLAQAAGAEVFATASAPKQAYLRSLGVRHVFDSRSTAFGEQIIEATGGDGVDVVLNSLTGEGFIDASLACLAQRGRFVELARVGILSPAEMAAARPDVAYSILELDVLKEHHQEVAGDALRRVMAMLAAGDVTPLVHTRWSLAEAEGGIKFMRAARHIGKIVFTTSPLETGRLRPDRTYLVTGGLGGIGCVLAGWLAERGAGAIVLNGRRDPDPEAAAAIEALRGQGATVAVELADVTDPAALDAMLARIDAALPPLGGVIHSVGVLSDGALTNQTWEKFTDVLWPKVLGAWHLHRATADRDLDLFVLFSSVAGVLGNAGQANHSAANAFLDQLAAHRRSVGLPGQSIAWGAWSGLGEAEEQRERIARQLEAQGTGWIAPAQGLRALEGLMRQDLAAGMVAAVDWQVFSENHEQHSPLLEDLLEVAGDGADAAQEAPDDPLAGIGAAAPAEREQMLVSFLQRELQAVMRLPTAPAPGVEFSDLGMDSLMAVEMRNRVNRALAGTYVAPNTVVFDYPSIASLAGHLAAELGGAGGDEARPAAPAAPRAPAPAGGDAIAIVGMACRFPGADDLAGFWRQLEAGEHAVTDGRRDEGTWTGVAGDPANGSGIERIGAFVDGIDRFDAAFFRIAPIEARAMDPQQRLLLETSWQAIEDAGIDPESLKGSRTGVYGGVGGSEYRRLISAAGRDDNFLGTAASVTVGRVAFVLGLEGPAVPVDLACASSLVAVHQGAVALQRGEVDLALAGGVNTVLSPSVARFLNDFGMLSGAGRCAAFDASADGYVRGEGCGMVVLKRLSEAEADGDRIWAVVRGTAVNQNGAGLGITVPNGRAQEQVMSEALARAGVAAGDVDYLEAHGPATQMGDPIEVRAAASVYGQARDAERPLLMGSVKTNLGHLEAAAGVAGLIKTVLAMQRGVIPPHLHFRDPTPEVDWDRLPVRVTSEATPWPRVSDRPPLAGVNVFGISGANAHAVVEGYRSPEDAAVRANGHPWPAGAPRRVAAPQTDGDSPAAEEPAESGGETAEADPSAPRPRRLLPLSAKTPEALVELARRYLDWLDESRASDSPQDPATAEFIADMAWTASVGRGHFAHRAAVVFDDAGSLRVALEAVATAAGESGAPRLEASGATPQAPVSLSGAAASSGAPDRGSTDGADPVDAAARAYEAGEAVSFAGLFADERRRRIALPGYPFQRRRHWVEPPKPRVTNAR